MSFSADDAQTMILSKKEVTEETPFGSEVLVYKVRRIEMAAIADIGILPNVIARAGNVWRGRLNSVWFGGVKELGSGGAIFRREPSDWNGIHSVDAVDPATGGAVF